VEASGRKAADEILVAQLAAGKTIADAAGAANVSESTVYRRLKDDAFQARVRELRAQMVAMAAGRLAAAMTAASDVLQALLTSASEGIRLRASVSLIELGIKTCELYDLQARVEQIEQHMREQEQRRGKREH
jgi:hypothetical protein